MQRNNRDTVAQERSCQLPLLPPHLKLSRIQERSLSCHGGGQGRSASFFSLCEPPEGASFLDTRLQNPPFQKSGRVCLQPFERTSVVVGRETVSTCSQLHRLEGFFSVSQMFKSKDQILREKKRGQKAASRASHSQSQARGACSVCVPDVIDRSVCLLSLVYPSGFPFRASDPTHATAHPVSNPRAGAGERCGGPRDAALAV